MMLLLKRDILTFSPNCGGICNHVGRGAMFFAAQLVSRHFDQPSLYKVVLITIILFGKYLATSSCSVFFCRGFTFSNCEGPFALEAIVCAADRYLALPSALNSLNNHPPYWETQSFVALPLIDLTIKCIDLPSALLALIASGLNWSLVENSVSATFLLDILLWDQRVTGKCCTFNGKIVNIRLL